MKRLLSLLFALLTLSGCTMLPEGQRPLSPCSTERISPMTTPSTTSPSATAPPEVTVSRIETGGCSSGTFKTAPSTVVPAPSTGLPAPSDPEPEPSDELVFSFVGDCMLASYKGIVENGNFADTATKADPSYFFDRVRHLFEEDDFTVVNLECVLTDSEAVESDKKGGRVFWYKGPTRNVEILKAASVEIASIANNHTLDYGAVGKSDTQSILEQENILWGDNGKILYLEKKGITVALICHGLWIPEQAETISNLVKKASKRSDYQIVYFHGGKEKVHEPEEWKVEGCHRIAEAGADLIIGNHPHVLQPLEIYQEVPILYSIGNFCYGGSRKPQNRTLIFRLRLRADDGEVHGDYELIPCYVYTGTTNNWQPAVIEDEDQKLAVLDFLAGKRESPL